MSRRTVAGTASLEGIGLHLGEPCHLTFHAAPSGHGITIQRVDITGAPAIRAVAEEVSASERRTQLGSGRNTVHTVEHVLAAVSALQIDDLIIEMDGPEPPILDGSAAAFVKALKSAGLAIHDGDPKILRLSEPVRMIDGESVYEAYPADGLELDVTFRGSDDCLAGLARGECDLAGFHVPDALPRAAAAAASLGKWLDSRKHVLLHFVRREQGLIVRPGSGIRNVHDLARPGVRFIHRQNPATEGGRDASVAAAVARGRADAGFGLRAEAAQHKLSFVPLAVERYFMACPKAALHTPAMSALMEVLMSPQLATAVRKLPGYSADQAGEQHPLDTALTWVEEKRTIPA